LQLYSEESLSGAAAFPQPCDMRQMFAFVGNRKGKVSPAVTMEMFIKPVRRDKGADASGRNLIRQRAQLPARQGQQFIPVRHQGIVVLRTASQAEVLLNPLGQGEGCPTPFEHVIPWVYSRWPQLPMQAVLKPPGPGRLRPPPW